MKKHTIKAFISKGEAQYVAECFDLPIVTQGSTLDQAMANLQEAVALHLEGEDLGSLGFIDDPSIIVTMEVEPACHAA